ncbi:MAG: hypothetical protein PHV39_08600 [Methanomicrobium sp.]|nr:hypothetical protein [Methanomicrobium sp.]
MFIAHAHLPLQELSDAAGGSLYFYWLNDSCDARNRLALLACYRLSTSSLRLLLMQKAPAELFYNPEIFFRPGFIFRNMGRA